jgi:hypothetical protein
MKQYKQAVKRHGEVIKPDPYEEVSHTHLGSDFTPTSSFDWGLFF